MFGIDDILTGAGAIGGAVVGQGMSEADYARALAQRQLGINTLNQLNPEAVSAIRQDPAMREAVLRSLAGAEGVAGQQGMDVQSRVAARQALDQASAEAQGRRQAVQEQMAARGGAGGGSELAAKLAGEQAAANQGAVGSARAASDARTRALQALSLSGQLGGQQQASDLASQSAENYLRSFNARQRLSRGEDVAGMYGGNAAMYQGKARTDQQYGTGLGGAVGSEVGGIVGGAGGYDEPITRPEEF